MFIMATNHVVVAMGQIATTILPRSSHSLFPTSFFLVILARCYILYVTYVTLELSFRDLNRKFENKIL